MKLVKELENVKLHPIRYSKCSITPLPSIKFALFDIPCWSELPPEYRLIPIDTKLEGEDISVESGVKSNLRRKEEALAVSSITEDGDKVDIIASADILKKIFVLPYSKAQLSVIVHCIGQSIVLITGPEVGEGESDPLLSKKSFSSSFAKLSTEKKEKKKEVNKSAQDKFLRVLLWEFNSMRINVGSDLLIFSNEKSATVSLHLWDDEQQADCTTLCEAWLDNVMAGVPELAICSHNNGVVKGYEELKTHAIMMEKGVSEDVTPAFHSHTVQTFGLAILKFLKENCKRDLETFWLYKEAEKDKIQLFVVPTNRATSSCEDDSMCFRGKEVPSLNFSLIRDYLASMGTILYRVSHIHPILESPSLDRKRRISYLKKCLELLNQNHEDQVVVCMFAHEQLARLYFDEKISELRDNDSGNVLESNLDSLHHVSEAIGCLRKRMELPNIKFFNKPNQVSALQSNSSFCACGDVNCIDISDFQKWGKSLKLGHKLWTHALLLGESCLYCELGDVYMKGAFEAVSIACSAYLLMSSGSSSKISKNIEDTKSQEACIIFWAKACSLLGEVCEYQAKKLAENKKTLSVEMSSKVSKDLDFLKKMLGVLNSSDLARSSKSSFRFNGDCWDIYAAKGNFIAAINCLKDARKMREYDASRKLRSLYDKVIGHCSDLGLYMMVNNIEVSKSVTLFTEALSLSEESSNSPKIISSYIYLGHLKEKSALDNEAELEAKKLLFSEALDFFKAARQTAVSVASRPDLIFDASRRLATTYLNIGVFLDLEKTMAYENDSSKSRKNELSAFDALNKAFSLSKLIGESKVVGLAAKLLALHHQNHCEEFLKTFKPGIFNAKIIEEFEQDFKKVELYWEEYLGNLLEKKQYEVYFENCVIRASFLFQCSQTEVTDDFVIRNSYQWLKTSLASMVEVRNIPKDFEFKETKTIEASSSGLKAISSKMFELKKSKKEEDDIYKLSHGILNLLFRSRGNFSFRGLHDILSTAGPSIFN